MNYWWLVFMVPVAALLILAVICLFSDKSGLTEHTWADRAPWRYPLLALAFLATPITIPCVFILAATWDGR